MRRFRDTSPGGGRSRDRTGSRLSNTLLALLALVSLGATIVVDDDGGTPDLATALASAQAGDTVLVMPGTYVGSFDVPEGVTLMGSGPADTILDGDGADYTVDLSRGAEVSRFTITGGEHGIHTLGGVRITSNVISGNGAGTQGGFGGGIVAGGCATEISGNTISGNGDQTMSLGGGLYMRLDLGCSEANSSRGIITNNVFEGNTGGLGAAFFIEDSTYNIDQQRWPSMTHNTIAGNLGGEAAYFWIDGTLWDLDGPPTGRLTNNVIAGNPGGGVANYIYGGYSGFAPYGPPTYDNLFFDNDGGHLQSPDTAIGQDGNSVADPLFRQPAAGDHRLQPGSPAIDVGAALSEPALVDLAGYPRPLDGDLDGAAAPDLGAYEETGEVRALTVAAGGGSVSWDPRNGVTFYNLYRGLLQELLSGGDYTQDPAGSSARRWCGLATPMAVEDQDPGPGQVFFYLATPGGPAEGSLGFTSSLQPRPSANPCT